jgi:hypothetical protein
MTMARAPYRDYDGDDADERETYRDGMIEVKPYRLRRRPFLVRFVAHYRAHRRVGVPLIRSLRYAYELACL